MRKGQVYQIIYTTSPQHYQHSTFNLIQLTCSSSCMEAAKGRPSLARPSIVMRTILKALSTTASKNKVVSLTQIKFCNSHPLFMVAFGGFVTRVLRMSTALKRQMLVNGDLLP